MGFVFPWLTLTGLFQVSNLAYDQSCSLLVSKLGDKPKLWFNEIWLTDETCVCFQGVSAAIIFVAAWVIKKYGDITKITTDTYTLVPCGILVGIGVLIFITALCGCCGTCRDNKCCLSTVSQTLFWLINIHSKHLTMLQCCAVTKVEGNRVCWTCEIQGVQQIKINDKTRVPQSPESKSEVPFFKENSPRRFQWKSPDKNMVDVWSLVRVSFFRHISSSNAILINIFFLLVLCTAPHCVCLRGYSWSNGLCLQGQGTISII